MSDKEKQNEYKSLKIKLEGELKESKSYYEKVLQHCLEVAEESKTIEARRDLSVAYINLGEFCQYQGKSKEAIVYYEKTNY